MSPPRRSTASTDDALAGGTVAVACEAVELPDGGAAPRHAVPDTGLVNAMHEPGSVGRWLSLIDAAVALRVSPDTVRRRVRRCELPSRHHERGRLLVELAADTPAPIGPAHSGDHELPRLRDRVALLERERATLTDELAARRQSETELRALLSQAQSLVARIAPPRGETVEHGATGEHDDAQPRRRSWPFGGSRT